MGAAKTITFTARGIPKPQGSKRAFAHRSTGRAIMTESSGESLKSWRSVVADAARSAMRGAPLLRGPVLLSAVFVFPRPKSHFRASGEAKCGSPAYVAKKPDIDKLLRAVLDAMTSIVFVDDSQVCDVVAIKRFADPGDVVGVDVAVRNVVIQP